MNAEEIRDELASIKSELAAMNRHLFVGNGRPPLCERVRVLEEQEKNCPAKELLRHRFDRASIYVAIASVVIAIYSATK